MRVKLDENVPMRAAAPLAALGHDVDTVVDEGLAGTADDALWPHVQEAARLATVFAAEEMERWTGALVVVTDHKVRVRRPSRPGTDPA